MIRHIVLFQLAASDPAQRAADTAEMAARLEALVGVIPGLQSMTLRPDLGLVDGNWDVALVSEHDDNAALEGYQAHPAHKEAGAYVRSVTGERSTVDYEL